jgi:hypothetical protein
VEKLKQREMDKKGFQDKVQGLKRSEWARIVTVTVLYLEWAGGCVVC